MRILPCSALIIHLAAGAAYSQTFTDLQIKLGVSYATDNGETPGNIWRSSGSVIVGKPVATTFSRGENCAAWSVSSAVGDVREDATTAWNIETTAIRVVRDAITFRLRWVRYAALRQQFDQIPLESGKAFRMPNEDIELTMRPGESAVVDTVRVPAGLKTMASADSGSCRPTMVVRAASLVSTGSRPSSSGATWRNGSKPPLSTILTFRSRGGAGPARRSLRRWTTWRQKRKFGSLGT